MADNKKSKADSKFTVIVSGLPDGAKKKPGVVNFSSLRALRDANPLVNLCIETLKHMVIKIPYFINVKERYQEEAESLKPKIDELYNYIEYPNQQDSYRAFWLKTLEDVLTIDRGAIETVYNLAGEPIERYHVDGTSIFPIYNEEGILQDPAYIQLVDNLQEPSAVFSPNEMDILTNSPDGSIGTYGYGKSPVERIISNIVTYINADNFNGQKFTDDNLPPFAVNLEGVDKNGLEAFKANWNQQTLEGMWNGIFTNAKGMSVEKLRESNQEMQFYELTLWLARVIIGAFELSPQDLGITMDVNKATAQSQQDITKSQSLRNLLDLMAEYHNRLIYRFSQVDPDFGKLEFQYDELDKLDSKTQAEIDKIEIEAGIFTADEKRLERGMAPRAIEQESEDEDIEEETEQVAEENIELPPTKEVTKSQMTVDEFVKITKAVQKEPKSKYHNFYGN